jgi:nickel-dependent lactate racemase
MILFQAGSEKAELSSEELREGLFEALSALGPRKRVLIVPPDITRIHSRAGELARYAWEYYGDAVSDILPALGTHAPMTDMELETMFPGIPASLFRVHDWRKDVAQIGTVSADFVEAASSGAARFEWPVQLNRLVAEGGHDLILSIGQVVPHEVMGMANYNKNLLIGCGGPESINKSHYLGAICGLESLMGRADNPPRRLLNHAWESFASRLPVVWVHTVIARGGDEGLKTRGLFIGDDVEAFSRAAELSSRVNILRLEEPMRKAVVYLNPEENRSTWLGNKSIYRTRMALAEGAELIVLAPGVSCFGEDPLIDALIRKYGYRGREATLRAVESDEDLSRNLGAAAHLMHGSPEGRFRITYCPGGLSRREVESVGFGYGDLGQELEVYDPGKLCEGWNELPSGERLFFIENPALGLWSRTERLKEKT